MDADADHDVDPSSTITNGEMVKTDELGTRINDADNDIDDEVRDRYHAKLVMYGSTQTHSIGVKVSDVVVIQSRFTLFMLTGDPNRPPRSWG